MKVTCFGMCDACQKSGNCEIEYAELNKKTLAKEQQKARWDKYLKAALEPDIW